MSRTNERKKERKGRQAGLSVFATLSISRWQREVGEKALILIPSFLVKSASTTNFDFMRTNMVHRVYNDDCGLVRFRKSDVGVMLAVVKVNAVNAERQLS